MEKTAVLVRVDQLVAIKLLPRLAIYTALGRQKLSRKFVGVHGLNRKIFMLFFTVPPRSLPPGILTTSWVGNGAHVGCPYQDAQLLKLAEMGIQGADRDSRIRRIHLTPE